MGFVGIWLNLDSHKGERDILEILFIAGIVSLVASLLFGLWSKFEFNKFFNKWGDFYFTEHEKLYSYMKGTGKISGEKLPEYLWKTEEKKLNQSLFPWQFKAQICLLGLGIVFLMFVLLGIM